MTDGYESERLGKEMLANMPKGKPTYKELKEFIELYMHDDGCGCHLCPIARKLLLRIEQP